MVWDGIIACYLFLAGLGAGAFALAALAGFVKPDAVKLRTLGYLIAPIAVAVGTVLLMVDAKAGLQNPLRFFGLLANFSSVMAWGVVILVVFMVVSVIALVIMLRKKTTPRVLDIIGLVCAVAVAVYTGLLLGDAPGFPLWNPIVLPLLFLVSALSTGFAAVLLVAHIMKSAEPKTVCFLKKTGLVFPVLEAILLAVLLMVTASTGGSAGAAASASVASLIGGSYAIAFWVGLVIVGLVVPFCIEVMRMMQVKKASVIKSDGSIEESLSAKGHSVVETGSVGFAIVGEVGILIGGFMLRYLIIMAAVPLAFG
ncbi:MAG: NrfD/PsrC family molybdoenzyme membrane anchor subunit [Gordonibacter sp.]